MVFCGHLESRFCAAGCHRFALGIPACMKGCKRGFVTRGLVSRPPCVQLLIPSLYAPCAGDTDLCSPYCGMSMGVHRDFLSDTASAVRADLPSAWFRI
jgi:hypothetical protein